MTTHRFDPISAILALVAFAGGLAVMFEATDPVGDADAGIWLAVLALAIGFVLVPWGRRDRSDEQPEELDLVDLDA